MTTPDIGPLQVEFFSLYPDIREPEMASRDVRGSLPVRAVQRCPPVTTAAGFGWYIYPPIDFALRWDGQTTEWSLLDDNEPAKWRSLAGNVQGKLPFTEDIVAGMSERRGRDRMFDEFGRKFTYLNSDPRSPNMVEVQSGIIARTSPGWWLLTREAPNWPRPNDHQVMDGVIETDWYRSDLPTIVRLTQPHRIVRFYQSTPIMAVQPVPRYAVEAARTPAVVRRGADEFPDEVWNEFVMWARHRRDPQTSAIYATERRSRQARVGPET